MNLINIIIILFAFHHIIAELPTRCLHRKIARNLIRSYKFKCWINFCEYYIWGNGTRCTRAGPLSLLMNFWFWICFIWGVTLNYFVTNSHTHTSSPSSAAVMSCSSFSFFWPRCSMQSSMLSLLISLITCTVLTPTEISIIHTNKSTHWALF